MRNIDESAHDDIVRVIICDDDPSVVEELRSHCARFSQRSGASLQVETYTDGDKLVECYRGADVLLIDVEMPLLDGLQASAIIRELDKSVRIVFVTSYERYAISGYRVGAYRYLIKPVSYPEFEEAVGGIVEQCRRDWQTYVSVRTRGAYRRLRVADIVMIETRNGHRLEVTCADGEAFETAEAISSMARVLEQLDFYQPHRCYLVNFAHVSSLSSDGIVMDDGSAVPVSKYRKARVLQAFSDYLERMTIGPAT